MHFLRQSPTLTIIAVSIASLLSACGDTGTSETGGGAGDPTDTLTAQANGVLIQPFVGVYNLQDGWNGFAGEQAFISIREPGDEGTAVAVLFEIDDFSNCVLANPSMGEVRKDPFSTSIFMDDISLFDEAVLAINGDTLTITFTDIGDIDDDGDNNDRTDVEALAVGITEIDIGEPC